MKNGIAVAGNMIVDILYPIQGLPGAGELTTILDGISRSVGGAVCNVIIDIAKLDPSLPLQALGRIGEDAEGDYIIEKLKMHKNIDLKQVVNTNKCLLHLEKHGDKLLIISCIDNLLKGASGQAVHNMNLMFNLEETVGLRLKPSAF